MSAVLKDVSEACEYLSIGRTKLYDLIREEKIKSVRIGRKVLFKTSDLDAFVASLAG